LNKKVVFKFFVK